MRKLERENYYNVINGYKELILALKAIATADEVYKTGTTFDEVYALCNFEQLHTISASGIMSIMGFTANWTNITKLI